MLQEWIMRQQLAWISKRVGLILGLLTALVAFLTGVHLSENALIPLVLLAIVSAHLWLLAWLTYKERALDEDENRTALHTRWHDCEQGVSYK